ncbi:MAG: hypothetical protein LBP69_02875 [Treponema sp.]|jgi:hypothetical protein|nr:hypothetical protein [Treponema sp.]
MSVQNKKTPIEVDVPSVVDEVIVNTVYEIFSALLDMAPVQNLFDDLTDRLATELMGQSILEFNLELSEDQRNALTQVIRARGNDTVNNYLLNLDKDKRTKDIYAFVKEHASAIADSVLRSIGQAINRGAIINATAVQANAKGEEYDEILLRKSKGGGDITIPTHCILMSTNCVSVIQESCKTEGHPEDEEGEDQDGEGQGENGEEDTAVEPEERSVKKARREKAAADKPARSRK